MNRYSHGTALRTALPTATLAAALGLAGCLDYTFETTVEPDGSGVRIERLEVTRNQNLEMSEADLRALTLTHPERGWRTSVNVDEDGDTTWILERRSFMEDLAAWSEPDQRTLILGTTPAHAEKRLGYVRLGDVVFRSSIQVGVSHRSDGASVISYREAFVWDNAMDAMVEVLVTDLDQRLKGLYPRLTDAERASIVGYARARIRIAGEEGLFSDENEDEAIRQAAERTAEHGVKIVRMRYPDSDAAVLRQAMEEVMAADDEQVTRLLEELLPGLHVGFNSRVVYRLTLPGRVTTSNARGGDGTTMEWEFSPLDDPTRPVVIFAESVIGG